MNPTNVNLVAIVLAVIVNLILGAAWNSKQKSSDKTKIRENYLITTITAFVLAYSMALLIKTTNAYTFFGGLKVGLVTGVGVVGATTLADYVQTGKPIRLFLINSVHQILNVVIAGLIMVALP